MKQILADFMVPETFPCLTEAPRNISRPTHTRKSKSNRNSTHSGEESAPHAHTDRLGNVIAPTQPVPETSFILHATESTGPCTVTTCLGFLDCQPSGNPGQITEADKKRQEGSKQPQTTACQSVVALIEVLSL